MKFQSKKDILFSIVLIGGNILIILITLLGIIKGEMGKNESWAIILNVALVVFLFWVYYGTSYELSKEEGLVYTSGPIKGKIRLNRITEIVKGKTLWVGYKHATSRKGLIIKYDKYNEIYISPKTNESFIKKILEFKKDIKITQ